MNNEPNTPLDANGDPKTDYQRGYDLGRACDTAEFNRIAHADYIMRGKDGSEFNAGWMDGSLDFWLDGVRRDLRSLNPTVAIHLMNVFNFARMGILIQREINGNEQK